MGGEIPSLSPEQALSAERQPQEYAAVMARAVRESRPKVLRSMLHPGYADIAHQPYVVVGEQRIHIGTEQPVTHTLVGRARQARMRYGIRVGDAEHVATSTTEIAQALGERAKNATAPVLFELARQYNKLSQKTIQEADELGIATVATTTRPDSSTYTTIYFADGPSGKVIRLQLDNLPSKVTITPHQLTEIRQEIASHREVLKTIPQQALTVHIEDEGESMTFSAPTGNIWRVETTPPQQMPEAVTPEESEATGYAKEYIAQAGEVSDADLQRRSDEVGREIGEVLSLSEEEVVRRRGLLREWMASRGYEVPVNYAYQHTYLMLSSQEKADFDRWMQEREEAASLDQAGTTSNSLDANDRSPTVSSRMSLRQFLDSTRTSRLEYRISHLDVPAARTLLRQFAGHAHSNPEFMWEEKERNLLIENLPQIVELALENPSLHMRLIHTLFTRYTQSSEEMYGINKAFVREIFSRLVTPSDVHTKFIRTFMTYMKNFDFRHFTHLFMQTSDDTKKRIYSDIFDVLVGEDIYSSRNIDAYRALDHLGGSNNDVYMKRDVLNMLTILQMEQRKPGICERLANRNGIHAFYRYPPKLLLYLDGQSERPDTFPRKSLFLIGSYDTVGEVQQAGLRGLKRMKRLEKYGIQPILFEISSLDELEDLANQTDSKIREQVFQIVFEGHGDTDILALSESENITLEDIQNDRFLDILRLFPNLKTILLAACSSGKADGFANALGDKMKIPVDAFNFIVHEFYKRVVVGMGPNGIFMRKNPIGVRYGQAA